MTEAKTEYQPLYTYEFEQVLKQHHNRLTELFDGEVRIQMMPTQRDPKAKELNRAIYITPKDRARREEIEAVVFIDHDDTMEPYTSRKSEYNQGLLDIVSIENPEQCTKVFEIVNKAARARPITGVSPERYSPLLEMVADTVLLDLFSNNDFGRISALNSDPTEDNARQFIFNEVIPLLSGTVTTFTDTENGKIYFREKKHQALAVDWNQKPFLVSQKVWDLFIKHMTRSAIPEAEIPGLNLDPKIFWIVSTFGEVGFQLEKVMNALQVIKVKTGRVSDGILVFTRGRKEPVVSSIIDEFPPETLVFVLDDSLGQLAKYAKNETICLLRATREGSKRAHNPTPEDLGAIDINMETGDLNHQLMVIISQDQQS